MYDFYFDSGTTNTRAYLLKDAQIARTMCAQIGSRDSALHNDNTVLVRELRHIYDEVLARQGISETDIRAIYMSGMISSPNGLVEIEHLSTPVSRQVLARNIACYRETRFFNRDVYLVPGIKTLAKGEKATLESVDAVNNMRGEETEIMGILHRCPLLGQGRAIVVLPGSHTQVAFLQNGTIENISSNITGELYNAIVSETILSSAVAGASDCALEEEMIQKGYKNLQTYGFNRALYIVRSLLLFTGATLAQRRSYMEGVLNGGVMDAITAYLGNQPGVLAIAGPDNQYAIYAALAKAYFPQFTVLHICPKKEMPFSVEGILSLLAAQ